MFDWSSDVGKTIKNALHEDAVKEDQRRAQAKISHANWLKRQYKNWPAEKKRVRREQIAKRKRA